MKKIITTAVAALTTSLWMAVPATAQNREHQQMAAELRMLQEQTQQLALALAQVGEALKAVNARMDATDRSIVKAFADQKLILDGVARDLDVVRQGTQDTNSNVRRIAEELDALRTSLPSLLTQGAPVAPVDPSDPNATPISTQGPGAPPLPSTLGTSPSRMYDTAWADYTSNNFPLAITGFEQFLKAFPQSDRADDAQFYIGESHFSQNRFADAVTAYNQVIQNYPKGDQVALAYYKRGMAQQRLGDVDGARASFEIVIKNYPNETAAILAKQRLAGLGPAQPAGQRSPG
jgi:tol-pal system protein YbgF